MESKNCNLKKCRICGGVTNHVFTAKVMNRYDASYRSCSKCDYLACESPHWLTEAYAQPITSADTGLMARNIDLSRKISVLIDSLFDSSANYLDYAGGYGVFTRLMRDIGYKFYHHDIYTENIFAKNYEWDKEKLISGITCFECLEHLENPLLEIRKLRDIAPLLIFSTTPLHKPIPSLDWDYYAFDHGQHISFYSPRTIQALGSQVKMHSISIGSIHILSERPIKEQKVRWLLKNANRLPYPFSRRTLYETIIRKRRRQKNQNDD
jgi:hypothetical protein